MVSLDGRKLHSSELQGKIIIVDFWATWCAPCVVEFKELEKLQNQVKDNPGVVVLVINEDDGGNMDVARKFLARRSFKLPFYVDSVGMAYKAFEAPKWGNTQQHWDCCSRTDARLRMPIPGANRKRAGSSGWESPESSRARTSDCGMASFTLRIIAP